MLINTCKLFFLHLHHAAKISRNHMTFPIKYALQSLRIMCNTLTTSTAMTMTRAVITLATSTTGIPAVK